MTIKTSSSPLLTTAAFLALRGYLLMAASEIISNGTHPNTMESRGFWSTIPMPLISHFAGFGFKAPTNEAVWALAKQNAMDGKPILSREVSKAIKSHKMVLNGETESRLKIADVHLCERTGFVDLANFTDDRAPIAYMAAPAMANCIFGVNKAVELLLKYPDKVRKEIPSQGFVGLGSFNENWGFLSTHILNRTIDWEFRFDDKETAIPPNGQLEDVRPLLDYERLIMMAVNQHHNITHPKVISIPLGIDEDIAFLTFKQGKAFLHEDRRITNLMLAATSNWGVRSAMMKCVQSRMGAFFQVDGRLSSQEYVDRLLSSATVLCLPGLGYDTYRIFEALLAGAMPVLERGTGLDRSFHKLPVLLVDDFAMITPDLLRQAYVEALYHAEDKESKKWDYRRLTQHWWDSLLRDVSTAKSISVLMKRHPMPKFPYGVPFSRPLIPFKCDGKYGGTEGCGPGTHRTPSESCAIDFNTDFKKYDFRWSTHEDNRIAEKKRLAEELKSKGKNRA